MADNNSNNNNNKSGTVPWQKDPLHAKLEKDIVEGTIPKELSAEEAWKTCKDDFKSMGKLLFKTRFTRMQNAVAKRGGKSEAQVKYNKMVDKWTEDNPIQKKLQDEVIYGIIPNDMPINEAYKCYQMMSKEKFASCLKSMWEIVARGLERASEDADDYFHDRALHPHPETNLRGEPQWIDSDAQTLLGLDMDKDLHIMLSPQELWLTHEQYQEFLLEMFRGHIYQEVQTRKWKKQWVDGKKEYPLVEPPYWSPQLACHTVNNYPNSFKHLTQALCT